MRRPGPGQLQIVLPKYHSSITFTDIFGNDSAPFWVHLI